MTKWNAELNNGFALDWHPWPRVRVAVRRNSAQQRCKSRRADVGTDCRLPKEHTRRTTEAKSGAMRDG